MCPCFSSPGVEDLFSSLQHIQSRLEAVEDQKHVAFLSQLFHNSRFQQALDIHNKVNIPSWGKKQFSIMIHDQFAVFCCSKSIFRI